MRRLTSALVVLLASVPLLIVAETAEARSNGLGAIVYVSDIDSPAADMPNDEVYLMTPANRRVHRMTKDDGTAERNPTLSPDGRWLAFVRSVDDPASGDLIRCRVRLSAGGLSCTDEHRVIGPVSTQRLPGPRTAGPCSTAACRPRTATPTCTSSEPVVALRAT